MSIPAFSHFHITTGFCRCQPSGHSEAFLNFLGVPSGTTTGHPARVKAQDQILYCLFG